MLLYGLGIAGWLTMMMGTIFQSFGQGETVHAFSAGTDWPKATQAAAVFVFVRQFASDHPKVANWDLWKKVSGLTFGTYLIHMVILQTILTIFHINNLSWWWSIAGVPVVIICTLGVVILLKKIPGIRRVL